MPDLLSTISNSPFFAGFPERSLAELASYSTLESFGKGDVIFLEGDPCRGLFVVSDGRLKLYKSDATGHEHIVHFFEDGDVFAEVVAFDGRPYPVSGIALTALNLICVAREGILNVLRSDFDIAMKIIGTLGMRNRELVRKIEMLTLKEAFARVATIILEEQQRTRRKTFTLPDTKQDLSLFLGITPETISRILRYLSSEGIVSTTGHTYTVHSISRLGKLAK